VNPPESRAHSDDAAGNVFEWRRHPLEMNSRTQAVRSQPRWWMPNSKVSVPVFAPVPGTGRVPDTRASAGALKQACPRVVQ
jgi:hypothetical protein